MMKEKIPYGRIRGGGGGSGGKYIYGKAIYRRSGAKLYNKLWYLTGFEIRPINTQNCISRISVAIQLANNTIQISTEQHKCK